MSNYDKQLTRALNYMRRSIELVQEDDLTPLAVATDLEEHLESLCSSNLLLSTQYGIERILYPSSSLQNELLACIVPKESHERLFSYRDQYNRLKSRKEEKVADSKFEIASQLLAEQRRLIKATRELLSGVKLVVTPELLRVAIQNLKIEWFAKIDLQRGDRNAESE